MAEGTNTEFLHLSGYVDKIKKLKTKLEESKSKKLVFEKKHSDFLSLFSEPKGKLILYGVLCVMALLFDFLISTQTMGWIYILAKKRLPVELIALIFTCFDGGLAILVGGAYARNHVAKIIERKKWRTILWGLGIIKIALFITMVKIISPGSYSGSNLMMLFMVLFTGGVYVILDYMGTGLLFLLGSFRHFLETEIFNDSPETVEKKLKTAFSYFNDRIIEFKFDKKEVYTYYDLEEVK